MEEEKVHSRFSHLQWKNFDPENVIIFIFHVVEGFLQK